MHHENEKMALFEALYREYLVPLKKNMRIELE